MHKAVIVSDDRTVDVICWQPVRLDRGVRLRLPNAERAVVAREKLTEYLLLLTHPEGESKARFFLGFGFHLERYEEFTKALLNLALNNQVTNIKETDYGTQYVIIGQIDTPDGRRPLVRTVWQIDVGVDIPKFITARRERSE